MPVITRSMSKKAEERYWKQLQIKALATKRIRKEMRAFYDSFPENSTPSMYTLSKNYKFFHHIYDSCP